MKTDDENDIELNNRFDLANNVIREIHTLVNKNGISYMDACVHLSEKSGIEIEVLAEIVAKDELVKSKLELEAEKLNFLKKIDRLPDF